MDPVLTTLGAILLRCGEPVCGSAYLRIKNILDFKSNFSALETESRNLSSKKTRVMAEIESAERDGKARTPEISKWLGQVVEIEPQVSSILSQNLDGCCYGCSLRSRLGKELAEKLDQVRQLMGSCDPPYTMEAQVIAVEHIPGTSITDQETASKNLAKIREYLDDDRVGTIAMLGMGGIGKTTLITNLNNELESMDSAQPFSIVIWVTVSKDWSVEKIQQRIAERLKMTKKEGETSVGKAIRLCNRLRLEKKFIVILDDVWERIDLDEVGIPHPKDHVGSKIILTTRLQEVCRDMETDVQFPVAVLGDEESWDLFSKSAGEIVLKEGIKQIAEAVTKECGGLPLAIITVGRAMRGKQNIDLWKHALKALGRSSPAPYIQGIEKKLFLPLKLSYDSLEGNNIKPCFLYCCLYPEDFSIEVNELLQCWEAEGLLDEQEEPEEVNSLGIALIENLKDSCLLECGSRDGTVRLHDVVRDVAVWIASSSDDGHKSFIRPGFTSRQMPGVEAWGSHNRVSFMYGRLEMLPHSVTECSQVLTLLLQGNPQLHRVPVGFLRGFPTLRVLNLSETNIISLPPVEQLGELRALFLRRCSLLRELPPLAGLSKLQVLDLSGTCIEMSSHEAAQKFMEVNLQEHLLELYVDLNHVPSITFGDSTWLGRLRRFRFCIGSTTDTYLTQHNERIIYLCDVKSSSEAVLVFWSYASALVLVRSQCITEMWTGHSAVNLSRLKSLTVDNCLWTGSMVADAGHQDELILFPSLEVLSLRRVKNIVSISKLISRFGTNLKVLEVNYCHQIKSLLPVESLHKLNSLEEIYVNSCHDLTDIITGSALHKNALPNLQIMEFKDIPRLKSVCEQVMVSTALKQIEVRDCPLLKKLPLFAPYVKAIQTIKGEQNWWNQLQLENEDTKSVLEPCFQPL